MNERIKLLAEQADMTDDKFGMFFAKDNHNEDGVDLAKFAELIVRACAAEAHRRVCIEGNDNMIYANLLKHFGVEE